MKKKKKNKLTSAKSAKKKMRDSICFSNKSELISVEQSENRILSESIISKFNIPEEDNSAVDGYALNLKNNKFFFSVVGESKPGYPYQKALKTNESIKIFTGSNILKKNKINSVVMLEDCEIKEDSIKIKTKFKIGQNIRKKGEDVKKDKIVFLKGRKIRTVDLAQLLSLGIKKIKVYKKIKVGVFSTGSEINQGHKKKNHIFDANKITLVSMLNKIGCEAIDLGLIKDDLEETKIKILKNSAKCDLLVSTGGISSSETDMVGKVLSSFGKINFWKLAIKPGRPFAFGEINKTPFIGLPGNPVAAIVTFLMLVVDYIKILSGNTYYKMKKNLITSNFSMTKKLGRREWIRGWIIEKNNKLFLEKFKTTGSGIISSISKSEGIIDIDENVEYIKKGEKLVFVPSETNLSLSKYG